MITASEAKASKKNKLSALMFALTLRIIERRIKRIAKTDRFYIKINEGIILKLLYRKYYEPKIEALFVELGYKVYRKNNKAKYISWE